MSHPRHIGFASSLLIIVMAAGCNTTPSVSNSDQLIGKWICRDLGGIGHLPSVAVAIAVDFRANGESDWLYVDGEGHSGQAVPEEESRWSAGRGRLHVGDAPPMEYQVTGSKLRLIMTDMYGDTLTLDFERE